MDIKPGLGEGVGYQPHSDQQGDVRPQGPITPPIKSPRRGKEFLFPNIEDPESSDDQDLC